jgi:hypothetical protein
MTADYAFTLLFITEAIIATSLLCGLFAALFYGLKYMKPSKDH